LAQTHPSVRTGRPGQSIGPYVVGTQILQLQSGYNYKEIRGAEDRIDKGFNNVVRYGFSEAWEINSLINYLDRNQTTPSQPTRISRLNDFNLGLRYNVVNKLQNNFQGLGVQASIKMANNKGELKPRGVLPVLTVAASILVAPKMNLITNLGVLFNQDQSRPTHFATLRLSRNWNEQFGSYIEVFANQSHPKFRSFVDGGFFYLWNKDLQLDASIGRGNNENQKELFIDVGFSVRHSFL